MTRFNAPLRWLSIALLAATLAGCGRGDDIKVYRVSKEQTPAPHMMMQTFLYVDETYPREDTSPGSIGSDGPRWCGNPLGPWLVPSRAIGQVPQ